MSSPPPKPLHPGLIQDMASVMRSPFLFWRRYCRVRFRSYQERPATTLIDSIQYGLGLTCCMLFAPQSGKSELQAQLEAYLLAILSKHPIDILHLQPAWNPCAVQAIRRLVRILDTNLLTHTLWRQETPCAIRIGQARIVFLVAGGAAPPPPPGWPRKLALVTIDEAHRIPLALWEQQYLPLLASAPVTSAFWGQPGSPAGILDNQTAACLELEKKDRLQRIFTANAEDVRLALQAPRPPHSKYIKGETKQLERAIRPLIQKYGYKNLLLEPDLRSGDPAQTLVLRNAIIAAVLQQTTFAYWQIYTQLAKIMRNYVIKMIATEHSHQPKNVACSICGKPVTIPKNRGAALCPFHRRAIRLEQRKTWAYEHRRGLKTVSTTLTGRSPLHRAIGQYLDSRLDPPTLARLLHLRETDPAAYAAALDDYIAETSTRFSLAPTLAQTLLLETLTRLEARRWQQLPLFPI